MTEKLSSSSCPGIETHTPDFLPVFRIAVCSDVHIMETNSLQAERFAKLFHASYCYSDRSVYRGLDSVVAVGDITNHGFDHELKAYQKTADANIRKDETSLLTVMGGHEFFGGSEDSYLKIVGGELDWHIVIKGIHLIGLSVSDAAGHFSNEKCEWLGKQLAIASAADSEMPIFTFQHLHIKDTVYVSQTWYAPESEQLNAIYEKYPQVVNFSGHSHGPINHPLSAYQKNYSLFGTGTLDYFEMEADMHTETIPQNAHEAAQFYLVEVDAEKRVRVLPYNLLTDSFFRSPANVGPSSQLVYRIERPADTSSFLYTPSRKDKAVPPYFTKQARIRWSVPEKGKLDLSFEHAKSAECVYGYFISYDTGKGDPCEKGFYSDYYIEPPSHSFKAQLEIDEKTTVLHVSVTPVNIWGMRGEPLRTDIILPSDSDA